MGEGGLLSTQVVTLVYLLFFKEGDRWSCKTYTCFLTMHVAIRLLICFAKYFVPLKSYFNDMLWVVNQLLKLIATYICLSRLSRSETIKYTNVYTILLGLVFVSYLSIKFTCAAWSSQWLGLWPRHICQARRSDTNDL